MNELYKIVVTGNGKHMLIIDSEFSPCRYVPLGICNSIICDECPFNDVEAITMIKEEENGSENI